MAQGDGRSDPTGWALRLGIGLVFLTAWGGASAEPLPDPLPLAWCLERAESSSPDVEVARAAAEAAEARIYPAGALPDPRLRYELSNVPTGDFDLESTPLSGQQLGLSQKLPFPGLLGRERDAASSAAAAADEALQDESRTIAALVERAWVALGFAQRAFDITEKNIELVRQLANIARAKYEVGEGLQQDVIRAQVVLTELLDERLRREAAIRSAEARLGRLLDLSFDAPLPRTTGLRDGAAIPDLEPLLASLESTSPRLHALLERIEATEHRRAAARLEGYPDVDLGVGYRIRRDVQGATRSTAMTF